MSNSVLPSLPGLEWNVGRTVLAPPVKIRTTPSDREYRARDATVPRYQYAHSYEFLRGGSLAEWQALEAFFKQHGGDFESWLYDDVNDNTTTATQFGLGTGSTTSYQLLRSLGGFLEPVSDVNGRPDVFLNGVKAGNIFADIGSFETDSNADGMANGWGVFVGGAGDGSRTHSISRLGNASDGSFIQYVEITAASNSNDTALYTLASKPVYGGLPHTLTVDLRTNASSKVFAIARWLDSTGAQISDSTIGPVTPMSYLTPRLVSATFTAPANATQAQILIRGINTVGEYMAADAVQLEQGSVATSHSRVVWSISGGTITFEVAPAAGVALTWTGKFYRRCRFLRGQMEFRQFMQDYWEAKKVEFISIKPGSQ